MWERLAGHLDRVWPDVDPATKSLSSRIACVASSYFYAFIGMITHSLRDRQKLAGQEDKRRALLCPQASCQIWAAYKCTARASCSIHIAQFCDRRRRH